MSELAVDSLAINDGVLTVTAADGSTTAKMGVATTTAGYTALGVGTPTTESTVTTKLECGLVWCRATFTLADLVIVMADEAGVVAYGNAKLMDFPTGIVRIHGARLNLTLGKSSAGINDDFDGDISLGFAAASNNATLSGTEADIIASTPIPQASGGTASVDATGTASEAAATFDGTSTAGDLYLNILGDDADHDGTTTPANITATGTVSITYTIVATT